MPFLSLNFPCFEELCGPLGKNPNLSLYPIHTCQSEMLPHSYGKHTVVFFTVKTVVNKGFHENKLPSLQMSLKIQLTYNVLYSLEGQNRI